MADQVTMVPVTISTPGSAAPKPGVQKTEFWITAASMVMPLAQTLTGHMDPATAAAIMAAVGGIYTACRSVIYALHASGVAKAIPDLPQTAGAPK